MKDITVDLLLVGGGGGKFGSGGGAGQVLYTTNFNLPNGTHSITIGNGGYNITINNSEVSDWAFSLLMVWDQFLTDAEVFYLNKLVSNYMNNGVSIRNILNFMAEILKLYLQKQR